MVEADLMNVSHDHLTIPARVKTGFAVVGIVLATSCHSTPSKQQPCRSLGDGFRLVGPPHSADELEAFGKTFAARNPAAPQVPFAYGNKQWELMKSLMRPGDMFREVDNPMVGPGLPFPDGYALVRGKCVVAELYLGVP
jgi:hypothetical protein